MTDVETARACAAEMYANDVSSQSMGIEIDIPAAGVAIATMTVRDDMANGFNICHGGHVFTLADTAFAFACNAYDNQSVAAGANIDFLRPAHTGDRLTATARETYRGRRRGFYAVEVHNQHGEAVALFRGRSVSLGDPVLT
ncbi:MAG: hydroxyphenylacetyl-CoA thioesterase PaaI [Pseudomonadota bacterium]